LLQQAGFRDIEVKIEPSGRYRYLKDDKLSSKLLNLTFKDNPLLSKLSAEQLKQLQAEYKTEIEQLSTEQGVWEDTTIFFVRANK
jgi:hypothetical protein